MIKKFLLLFVLVFAVHSLFATDTKHDISIIIFLCGICLITIIILIFCHFVKISYEKKNSILFEIGQEAVRKINIFSSDYYLVKIRIVAIWENQFRVKCQISSESNGEKRKLNKIEEVEIETETQEISKIYLMKNSKNPLLLLIKYDEETDTLGVLVQIQPI